MTNIESFKAAGVDQLFGRFLKDGAKESQGVFSNACKVAKLKPILKKGKKTDPSN